MSYFRFATAAVIAVILSVPASLQAQCNWTTGDSTKSTLPSGCVAGIGTTTPSVPLTIQTGTSDVISLRDSGGTARFKIFAQHSSYYFDLNATNYDLRLLTATAGGSGGNISFLTNSSGAAVERLRIMPNGNVGIGIVPTTFKLDVDGTGTGGFRVSNAGGPGVEVAYLTSNVANRIISYDRSASTYKALYFGTTSSENTLYLSTAGYVGIGTTAPASPLSVAGIVQSTTGGFKFPDGSVQTSAGIAPISGGNYNISGNVGIGADPGTIPLYVPKAGLTLGGTGNYVARFDNSTGTQGLLLGYDSANGGMLSSTGSSKPLAFWTNNGSAYGERMRIDAAGNVGIGSFAPNAALHVSRSAATLQTVGNENKLLQLGSDSNNNTYGGQFEFRERRYSSAVNGGHALAIYGKSVADATLVADKFLMTIQSDGKVGIGNVTPQKMLDVTGDIHASGTISGGNVIAQYQDVAEWVPSGQSLAAGTVVIINPRQKNEVMPSTRAYDTAVAGVVSERPGVLLGVPSDTKSMIATTGRVRVHVDATNRPVNAGDLLVTSEKPGVAMVSDPIEIGGVKIHRPGTLIGKALEPLPSGEGDILVLLSLQ